MGFLAVSGVVFWVIMAFVSVLIIWAIEEESSGAAFIISVSTIIAALIATDLWQAMSAHNAWLWVVFPGYLVGAVVWPIVKWISYSWNLLDDVIALKKRIAEDHKITDLVLLTDKAYDALHYELSELSKHGIRLDRGTGKFSPPSISEHLGQATCWGALWPWSLLWTVLRDPVRRFVKFMVERLSKLYDAISAWIFKGVN